MEETVYFIFYQQYGASYCTNGFRVDGLDTKTRVGALRKAREHIKMYLERPDRLDRDSIKNITLVEMKMVDGRPTEMTRLTNEEVRG